MTKLQTSGSTLCVDTPIPPPPWALLERELLRAQTLACQEFFNRYFDERGYLICIPRWGGNDGPDDAIENLTGWSMLHTLGGPDTLLQMYKKAWEGHLRQYTEAKTVDVPFARDGMYYKEFPVMFDWFHNAEGLTVFNLQGLSDPDDRDFQKRVRRFAGFYMNEDPQAPNYDPEHKIIRSMFNGSRGPLLRKATDLDWAGDPIEVEGRFNAKHGERNFEEMLAHFKDYTDIVGDHPLNLAATTLATNAYMLAGEAKYKAWLLEYVDAWVERIAANGGIIPSNIGLDGTIGGECDGKWYGGCYGWAFTVVVPQTGQLQDRNSIVRGIAGFGNALLATGDQRYVDVWRNMIDTINANQKTIDGQVMYPHMYGDDGWYSYTPQPYNQGALDVYYWSMNRDDLKRLPATGWIGFLEGQNPNYPTEALQRDFGTVRRKVEGMYQDTTTPDTRLSDDPMGFNPATVSTLIELMLGGLTPRHGEPLHCRVRYFDPVNRRAGIPEDVAALVEKLTDDEVTLTLVNINPVEGRTVVVQGGAYAEHQLISATADDQVLTLDRSAFTVQLAPGAGSRIVIQMKRYVNQPTFAFPWNRD
ncbi:MAG: hypothetical protein O7E52_15005 [Candidatus Poribacteria bacterium]|nr:hypothetical protein [Candidatus Poribacteria bacterium]